MSVDIAWDKITSGDDGEALAESIRSFIHAKFQQITLPRFISAVHVHSFEFGSVCPEVEIKDICDPLPDFYEDDEEAQSDESKTPFSDPNPQRISSNAALDSEAALSETSAANLHTRAGALQSVDGRRAQLDGRALATLGSTAAKPQSGFHGSVDTLPGPFARVGTPGIPGGTSNMGYFHFPMGGLSGAQTPLAAVAGGGPFATQAWLNDQQSRYARLHKGQPGAFDHDGMHDHNPTRPRTTGSISSPELGSPLQPSSPEKRPLGHFSAEKVSDDISSADIVAGPVLPAADRGSPSDLQVVSRVTYNGDIRMMLTAEILLDYPMPSFIKIPLKLSITGVTFDGVAIIAYIKNNMHFCFLDPEDAETLVGSSFAASDSGSKGAANKKTTIGSLLREIRVETEIGRQESGKQVLKNVGKVERFVLEQVRSIFEEEFVFPSFWTFLV